MDNLFTRKIKNKLDCYYFIRNAYDRSKTFFSPIGIPKTYPIDINIEITSFCNSRCKFCTHEELIKSGKKIQRHMDLLLFQDILKKLKEITEANGVDENILRIGPVGLGESFLHPDFFKAVSLIRKTWPKAVIHVNTNCINLKGKIVENIINSEIDEIVLSLGFNNPEEYTEWYRTNRFYDVKENIRNFLLIKGDNRPKAYIHNFDLNMTSKKYHQFKKEWEPFLGLANFTQMEPYIPLTDYKEFVEPKYPCPQLWTTIMIDVEGYVFPCCLGVWSKRDDDLCLGYFSDEKSNLLNKLIQIRQRHINGDFLSCRHCGYLQQNTKYFRKYSLALKKSTPQF